MSVGLRPWRTAKVGRDDMSIREQSQARASAVQIGNARCALSRHTEILPESGFSRQLADAAEGIEDALTPSGRIADALETIASTLSCLTEVVEGEDGQQFCTLRGYDARPAGLHLRVQNGT